MSSLPATKRLPSGHEAARRFLFGRIDYERTQSMPCSEEAMKLDRMRELLRRLGNPERGMPVIHVAGTKGKGSTSAMLAAVLAAAGLRTGLFTSPHLDRIEERIAVDGQPCSAEELVDLIELVRPAVEALDREAAECGAERAEKGTGPICATTNAARRCPPPGRSGKLDLSPFPLGPTFFEIITAMALCHFARRRVGAAVLEVGLGGRLDSTNVCTPRLSIITSISYDHTKQLGETLTAIATEKAGIIKPGVTVISGADSHEAQEVIRRTTRSQGCRLLELGADFAFDYRPPRHLEQAAAAGHFDFRQLTGSPLPLGEGPSALACHVIGIAKGDSPIFVEPKIGTVPDIPLSLPGRHQAANAALVLAAVEELRRGGWAIPAAAVRRGLAEVVWPARVEVVARRPTVVIDAAHNAASVAALLEVLDESFSARRRWLIFGTTQEKDLRGMIGLLLGRFDQVVFTRYANNPAQRRP